MKSISYRTIENEILRLTADRDDLVIVIQGMSRNLNNFSYVGAIMENLQRLREINESILTLKSIINK